MTPAADPKPKRRRRTPESARREILDAAGQRLMKEGPDGLRLQSIAADVGIAHSSILHHFGSRDGLLDALSGDALHVLERDLRTSLETPSIGDPVTNLFEKIARLLGERGYARLIAWQIMSGRRLAESDAGEETPGPDGEGGLLDRLAQTVHGMRLDFAHTQNQPEPAIDDTRSIVVMAACTVFGEALAGEVMMESAALGSDALSRRRFRQELAKNIEKRVFPEPATRDPVLDDSGD